MSIRIKVATSSKELQDVYKLRYQVYAEEEGRYAPTEEKIIIDQFDAMPNVANVIAYEGETPVGTMRTKLDSEIQLPADETYDFSGYRAKVDEEAKNEDSPEPIFVSSGMLAIAQQWRKRRDVFRALFKLSCDVAHSWKATHIIVTASIQSASIYRRLGFESLEKKVWYEPAGEHIVPMASDMDRIYTWAFGTLAEKSELLESFAGSFQYLLVSVDTRIFTEGSSGHEAYLISKGSVRISRANPDEEGTLNLATLGAGDMFGELSLIDDQGRSADATAVTNTELVVLSREAFWQKAHQDPAYVRSLLTILSKRLRDIDDRAFVYAHGSADDRLDYFLEKIKQDAEPSKKDPNNLVAKITIADFAYMASAGIKETELFLVRAQLDNTVTLTSKSITFIGK